MKSVHFLLTIFVIAVLSSCSKFQYVVLKSNLSTNDKKEFFHENDTCLVKYSFAGQNCPLRIEVYNKLSVPLYVDWKKSAVIINNKTYSLWEDKATLTGSTSEYEIKWNKNFSTTSGTIDGTVYRNEQISFIPPRSYAQVTPIFLQNNFVEVTKQDSIMRYAIQSKDGGLPKVERHIFNIDNSPLRFRCYLMYAVSENFSDSKYADNDFWISDVIKSGSKLAMNQPDMTYMRKTTGFGTFMAGTAVVGLLIVGAASAAE